MLWSAAFSKADGVVVGVGHDITKRKQMEEALRSSEENIRHERAFEHYLGIAESKPTVMTDFDLLPDN